ncbi:MAG: cell division protein FtsA [Deltaproteobacteria bacterium]|nr:cell division protein FtsA [Deltaproteobacteria bacterium]MBI3386870.1 cell division protein FtsA [Deltaproteobacteria bacterium]
MAKRGDTQGELLVGLDIGTAKVAAVVGEVHDGAVTVTGVGSAPCAGLRKGMVVNIDATVQAIERAVKEAEVMASCQIHSVFAGIGGTHIKSFNSHGVVAVKNREVASGDVARVVDAARAVALPLDRDILHVLAQEYVVDGQDGIKEPFGMSGVRLETRVHVVTTAIASAQNVVKCCQRSGLHVADLVFAPLAAAEAVLTMEERELGVALVEVGAGTTNVLIFSQGALKHSAVLGLGGNHVTSDIAAGLRTPFREAELLKQRHGCALIRLAKIGQAVEVASVGGRTPRVLERQTLAEIIEPRLEEIFTLAHRQIVRCGYEDALTSGIVLTGGGAMVDGAGALAEQVFQMPARLGVPINNPSASGNGGSAPADAGGPLFATAVGLVLYGAKPRDTAAPVAEELRGFGKVRQRMVGWIKEFF